MIGLLFGSLSVQAQQLTGSISGTVEDQSNAVVSGATITLLNQTTGDTRKTVSNDRGYFTFAGVIPGTYSVGVISKGFKSWKQADITLNIGDERTVTGIQLAVGAASDTIVVESASQEIAPTDNGERAALLSSQDIERLTVTSRELSELLKILPGVVTVTGQTGNGPPNSFTEMGPNGSALGTNVSPNGAAYRGGTAYLLDGANIIDPGCDCWSIASVNPDMTAEVKVQMANFGADNADGPVSVNVTSKSGGDHYHGQAYFYARNGVLNSNLWTNKLNGTKRTEDAYYYPGGNFGGPVRIPHSDFNKNNKLLFWAGYEYQWQNPSATTTLQSSIPSTDMMGGNFTLNNTTATNPYATNAVLCPSGFSASATNWCNNLSGGYDATGAAITNAGALTEDPGAKAIMSLFPTANADPAKNSGYNYVQNFGGQQNVYIMRYRVDYNLNENNKFFVGFQQGHDVAPVPAYLWGGAGWSPNLIPYPGGGLTNPTTSRVLTGDLLTVISPTLTNEFIGAWGFSRSDTKPVDAAASYITTTDYPYGTYFNGSLVTPGITGQWSNTFPGMPQGDVFSGAGGVYHNDKADATFSDNVTKVYKKNTFKLGAFTELASNYQGSFNGSDPYNGTFSFGTSVQSDPLVGTGNPLGGAAITHMGTGNPTANLVMGISSGFSQISGDPVNNLAHRTVAFYGMDNWKITPRLMLNIGWRFDHLGRWYDRAGNGMAVWLPDLYASDVAAATSYASTSGVSGASGWPFPGVRWHGVDPGIPNSGSPTRLAFTSPRMGLAYDVFGTGKTVVRGGWGEYRWNDQSNDYNGPDTTSTNTLNYNSPSGNLTMAQIGELGALSKPAYSLPSGSIYVADPTDYETAATEAYNLTISQQTPWHTLVEVAYVGNQTKNLLMGGESNSSGVGGSGYINQNKIPNGGLFKVDPVTGAAAPADPEKTGSYNYTDYFPYYQGYGQNSITMETHNGYANYNALQVSWAKQTGKLSFNLSYTWSRSLGIVGTTVDPFSVHGNYGILSIDHPQAFNASYAYDLGKLFKGNKILAGAINDWTISGTTILQSGGNLQALGNNQNLGLSIQDSVTGTSVTTLSYYGTNVGDIQPITTCDPKSGFTHAHQELNPLCFAPPALGVHGPRQYGYLGGPAYFNSDLTIYKTFHVHGKQAVQFRAAMFNFLNHPLRAYTSNGVSDYKPSFTTTDKVNFTSTLVANLPVSSLVNYLGTPDQKVGNRLGELSVKYNF